jgi:Icc-related predicted phosphoesterase
MPRSSSFSECNLFRPAPPTALQRFLASPTLFLATWLYTHQPPITSATPGFPAIKVVCTSDTHNAQPLLPDGDILIHAGDLTINGTLPELQAQLDWLSSLPHRHKIVIAGNHDVYLAHSPTKNLNWGAITHLENSSATLRVHGRTIKIYGAPQTPIYGNWEFQYPPSLNIWKHSIPLDTDILVTHGPARGHVDAASPVSGCPHLLREVFSVKPRLHVCGHKYNARGLEVVDWGWVQWGYDMVNMGEGGVGAVLVTMGAWVSGWMMGKRRGKMMCVNAAMREDERGEEGVVVEF